MINKFPILAAISLGLVLFVAKMRFVFKVVQAKTDLNVFNYSLALRLIVSGMVIPVTRASNGMGASLCLIL